MLADKTIGVGRGFVLDTSLRDRLVGIPELAESLAHVLQLFAFFQS